MTCCDNKMDFLEMVRVRPRILVCHCRIITVFDLPEHPINLAWHEELPKIQMRAYVAFNLH